jgi:hypothetical protein
MTTLDRASIERLGVETVSSFPDCILDRDRRSLRLESGLQGCNCAVQKCSIGQSKPKILEISVTSWTMKCLSSCGSTLLLGRIVSTIYKSIQLKMDIRCRTCIVVSIEAIRSVSKDVLIPTATETETVAHVVEVTQKWRHNALCQRGG